MACAIVVPRFITLGAYRTSLRRIRMPASAIVGDGGWR
jgi:hypothetical protein